MVVAVPFPDPPSYLRAIGTGLLELFVHGFCGLCGWALWANGWSYRKFAALRIRRARCSNPKCRTSFTFLPVFLAPAKWYDYPAIRRAADSLSNPAFETATAAITEWDLDRSYRQDDHRGPAPSAPTVRRWWASLARAARSEWLPLAVSRIVQRVPDHPLPFQPGAFASPHRSAMALLETLITLGGLIKYGLDDLKNACSLALALWCIEPIRRRRVLEPPSCVGRVAPGPSPNVTFRGWGPQSYPPGPSPPDGASRRSDGVPSR